MSTPANQIAFDALSMEFLFPNKCNIESRDYATGLEVLLNHSKIPVDQVASHVVDIVRPTPPRLLTTACSDRLE